MRTIHKYQLFTPTTTVQIPAGGKVRHVGQQGGIVMLWVEIDPGAPQEDRLFLLVGTGQLMSDEARLSNYLGTAHCGAFVWHVYEVEA